MKQSKTRVKFKGIKRNQPETGQDDEYGHNRYELKPGQNHRPGMRPKPGRRRLGL